MVIRKKKGRGKVERGGVRAPLRSSIAVHRAWACVRYAAMVRSSRLRQAPCRRAQTGIRIDGIESKKDRSEAVLEALKGSDAYKSLVWWGATLVEACRRGERELARVRARFVFCQLPHSLSPGSLRSAKHVWWVGARRTFVAKTFSRRGRRRAEIDRSSGLLLQPEARAELLRSREL